MAKREDLIWFLARYKSSEFSPDEQRVPDWTGFYHQVLTPTHNGNHLSWTFYLPSIDQPPTKIRTVQEILCHVKEKAEALKNKEADLIYCKTLEIILYPRKLELRDFVNLQMGAFHASRVSLLSLASDLEQLDWKMFLHWRIFDWYKLCWQSYEKENSITMGFVGSRLSMRLFSDWSSRHSKGLYEKEIK